VPIGALTEVTVHRGSRSNAGWGALIGSVVGVALGAVLGDATYTECTGSSGSWWFEFHIDCVSLFDSAARQRTVFGIGGGIVGAGLGALVGGFIRTNRWERVPTSDVFVSVLPHRDGFGLGASIAF